MCVRMFPTALSAGGTGLSTKAECTAQHTRGGTSKFRKRCATDWAPLSRRLRGSGWASSAHNSPSQCLTSKAAPVLPCLMGRARSGPEAQFCSSLQQCQLEDQEAGGLNLSLGQPRKNELRNSMAHVAASDFGENRSLPLRGHFRALKP